MEIRVGAVYLTVTILLTALDVSQLLTKCQLGAAARAQSSGENEDDYGPPIPAVGLIPDDIIPDDIIPDDVDRIVHSVEVVRHDGGTTTKYETTTHLRRAAEDGDGINDVMQLLQPNAHEKKVTRQTVVNKKRIFDRGDESSDRSTKIAAGSRFASGTNASPSTTTVAFSRQTLPDTTAGNVKSATRRTAAASEISADRSNVIPSNIDHVLRTVQQSSSNSNHAAASRPDLMRGGRGETNSMTTTTTPTGITDGGGSSSSYGQSSRKPNFRREKTTTIITAADYDDNGNGLADVHRDSAGYSDYGRAAASAFSGAETSDGLAITANTLRLNPIGGDGKMSLTGASYEDGSRSAPSRKPGGSFRRVKTTTIKHDLNGAGDYGEFGNANSLNTNNIIDMAPTKSSAVYGYNNNYNNNYLQTKSGETKNELPSSRTAVFDLVDLPDSFRRAQTTSTYETAEDGLNSQMAKLKLDYLDGEQSYSSNNNLHSRYYMGYDRKQFNDINNNGYVVAMGAPTDHAHMMPPKSKTGCNTCNGAGSKKKRKNKVRGGRGSKTVVGKNVPRQTRKNNTKTKSKTRSTSKKSKSCNCGDQKLNKRNSSSGSDSESDESTTRRKHCDHSKRNDYDHFQTDEMLPMPPGLDSTVNMIRPPPMKEHKKMIRIKQRSKHNNPSFLTDPTINTASNNIPNIYQQRFESPDPNELMDQYSPFPFNGPPPNQRPPPFPPMSLQNHGNGFPIPDFKGMLPPHFPRSGFMNLMKPTSSEQPQQTNNVLEITRGDNGHSEFIPRDTLESESLTSKTQNNQNGNIDRDQGVRYMQTISNVEKIGSNNPLEMHVIKLESIVPPNVSHKGDGFQTPGVEKFLPPLSPFLGLTNLLSEKGQQINDHTGLAKNNGENVAVSNQMDTSNSKYIMTTNTQISTTSDSYDAQDAERKQETIKNYEKIDSSYSPEAHVLETKSFTSPNQLNFGQFIPQMPFKNYVKGGGGNGGSVGGDNGGSGNGGSNGFAVYDWRKYLPSFMNLPSGPAQEQHKNDIAQSDNENSGVQQINTFTTKSMTTSDAQSSTDGSSNDRYTKITKTTKKISGDNPKEVHIVQTQTKKPDDKGYGYSYSYSY